MSALKDLVRTIPDYPKPGIMFRDVTTLLGDARGLKSAVAEMSGPFENERVDAVAGIEARGFILGGAIADRRAHGARQRIAHEAVGQHLLDRHVESELRQRIQRPVAVALGRGARDRFGLACYPVMHAADGGGRSRSQRGGVVQISLNP